jgi:hypothetical protein
MKMVSGLAEVAGAKSIAPCTVLKSPLPSVETTIRSASAGGGAALVLKVHALSGAIGLPTPVVTTCGSIFTT